ncbi:MAG: ABC transporter substrate-binding protein [Desulfobacterales bacterium]
MKKILMCVPLMVGLVMMGPRAMAQEMTLMLDWFPNVDHLPIYVALEKGYFAAEGIQLEILSPSDTADALKLAVAGKVDLAVSYEPQTIIAAAEDLPVRVVGRLVEHPLTTLLFLKAKGYVSPADLEGKTIGYTVPGLMDVLLTAFAKINAITDYTAVNVGFNIVPALTSGQVDAVMGPFKTYETVTMAAKGLEAAYFELEQWGIPDYDELILICGAGTLSEKSGPLRGFVRALARGLEDARLRPEEALQAYFRALPDVDQAIEEAAFKKTQPYFARTQAIDQKRWQTFADFALAHGLIAKPVDVRPLLVPLD